MPFALAQGIGAGLAFCLSKATEDTYHKEVPEHSPGLVITSHRMRFNRVKPGPGERNHDGIAVTKGSVAVFGRVWISSTRPEAEEARRGGGSGGRSRIVTF